MDRTYSCCEFGNIYMNINYKRDFHFAQRRNLGQTTKTNMVL